VLKIKAKIMNDTCEGKSVVTIVWNNYAIIKSISTISIHEISILLVPINKAFLVSIQSLVHSLNNNYFQTYVQIPQTLFETCHLTCNMHLNYSST
jgi:hypothetical protein